MGIIPKIFGFLIGIYAIFGFIIMLLAIGLEFTNIGISTPTAIGMFSAGIFEAIGLPDLSPVILLIWYGFWLWVASKLWHWGKPKQ